MPAESQPAIAVSRLSKSFGAVRAVAGVDFTVGAGELFGFLGPNGAGKTTIINLLTGLARPDAGTIRVGDIDCTARPRAAQHLLGVVPDESNLYPELSGFDNLCFCAALYGLGKKERQTRAEELLAAFELSGAAARKFAGYSKGMKRRLTIAAGIIHRPAILFLDEPTTGIDVASARRLRQLIAQLNQDGTTIFLTTHYIEEAERLCRRIAFIVEGRIVGCDTVANLLEPEREKYGLLVVCSEGMPAQPGLRNLQDKLAAAFPDLAFTIPAPEQLRVEAAAPIRVAPLVRFLEEAGIEVAEARRLRPTLEDVFVKITGLGREIMGREKEKRGNGG